jgi:hypothetical protein
MPVPKGSRGGAKCMEPKCLFNHLQYVYRVMIHHFNTWRRNEAHCPDLGKRKEEIE